MYWLQYSVEGKKWDTREEKKICIVTATVVDPYINYKDEDHMILNLSSFKVLIDQNFQKIMSYSSGTAFEQSLFVKDSNLTYDN